MKKFILLVLLFCASSIFSQDEGWYKTKFGMTNDDLVNVLKDDGVEKMKVPDVYDNNIVCDYWIKEFKIQEIVFQVYFLMKDEKLYKVKLKVDDSKRKYFKDYFDAMTKMLETKYGKKFDSSIDNDEKRGWYNYKSTWMTSNTKIELNYWDIATSGYLMLVYTTRNIEDSNKF